VIIWSTIVLLVFDKTFTYPFNNEVYVCVQLTARYTQLVHRLKKSYLVYQCPVILL